MRLGIKSGLLKFSKGILLGASCFCAANVYAELLPERIKFKAHLQQLVGEDIPRSGQLFSDLPDPVQSQLRQLYAGLLSNDVVADYLFERVQGEWPQAVPDLLKSITVEGLAHVSSTDSAHYLAMLSSFLRQANVTQCEALIESSFVFEPVDLGWLLEDELHTYTVLMRKAVFAEVTRDRGVKSEDITELSRKRDTLVKQFGYAESGKLKSAYMSNASACQVARSLVEGSLRAKGANKIGILRGYAKELRMSL